MALRIWVSAAVALCLGACALDDSTRAAADPVTTLADGAVGTIEFASYTPTSQLPFLTRTYLREPPVTVSGVLSLPPGGAPSSFDRDGKLPAVVIAHGTGGVSDEREREWARRLNSWGMAAFVLDSYTGRGIKPPIYADQTKFTHMVAHLLDAYLALGLLATHPRIDPARVALMGFSRGGEVAVNGVFEPFRRAALGPAAAAAPRFAAYVAFYPYCNFRHTSRAVAEAPMLMLLGGADEMTEPEPCRHLAGELRARGVPVRVVTYANAQHGFDRLAPVAFDKSYVGIRKCEAEYDLDTKTIRRLDTGAPLATKEANDAWLGECRKKGARFGGDAQAREASIAEVRRYLGEVFGR